MHSKRASLELHCVEKSFPAAGRPATPLTMVRALRPAVFCHFYGPSEIWALEKLLTPLTEIRSMRPSIFSHFYGPSTLGPLSGQCSEIVHILPHLRVVQAVHILPRLRVVLWGPSIFSRIYGSFFGTSDVWVLKESPRECV